MHQDHYQDKVAQQVAQYAETDIHQLPPIYHYWSNKYVRPKLNAVMNADSVTDFYVSHILERVSGSLTRPVHIVSLGAGDAETEIELAQTLLHRGLREFHFEGLELSPILIDRAKQRIHDAGLGSHISITEADLNASSQTWPVPDSCTAVIANQVLHHMVELEVLSQNVARAIGKAGVFITADMIGRNGHMRWPEALSVVNALWDTLPDSLKFNHAFKTTDQIYPNWDCSSLGFEGIRAQDILPLLLKQFRFEKFLAFGGISDVFVDWTYGSNFNPNLVAHTRFIDRVEELNALLLELGVIKPTIMFSVLSNVSGGGVKAWKNLTPEFCKRDPQYDDLSQHRDKSESLASASDSFTVSFANAATQSNASGQASLRSGWYSPEGWGTWMIAAEAVIEILLPPHARNRPVIDLTVRSTTFLPKRLWSRSFTLLMNEQAIGSITFYRHDGMPNTSSFTVTNPMRETLSLRVIAHEKASPSEEGSPDNRCLGLGIIDITVG